jgi:hypothetical protein
LRPDTVMRVVRLLARMGVTSMLDHDEDAWRQQSRSGLTDTQSRFFLVTAYRAVLDLVEAGGWDAEYPRDIWRLRRLGFDGERTLRFDRIPQPWLRELAKRRMRWRLCGLGLEAATRPLLAIARFARFLDSARVERITAIDRAVLERYLADLHAEIAGTQLHGVHIGHLNGFFTAIRQHRWDPDLPTEAMFFTEDYPKRRVRLPRALAEHVMTQLEQASNLARWDDPAHRLVTVILMRCGLRISDALRLPADCVVTDADGAPYLRYFNHKMQVLRLLRFHQPLRVVALGVQGIGGHDGAGQVERRQHRGERSDFVGLVRNPTGAAGGRDGREQVRGGYSARTPAAGALAVHRDRLGWAGWSSRYTETMAGAAASPTPLAATRSRASSMAWTSLR